MEQQVNSKKIILNNGLYLGLATVALSIIMYVTNMIYDQNWIVGLISFILMIVFIAMGIKAFKAQNNGYLSLSQGLKVGLGIALISSIVAVVYNLIFLNFIEPEFMTKMLEMQQQKMIETNPNLTQQQLDMAAEMGKKFSSPALLPRFQLSLRCFWFYHFTYRLFGNEKNRRLVLNSYF